VGYDEYADGTITTVAGDGNLCAQPSCPPLTDGVPAVNTELYSPWGVAADRAGNLFIADSQSQRIRKVSPDGIITTVAGNGAPGFSGDGGPASSAQLQYPTRVTTDSAGNLFVVDGSGTRIRKVSSDGTISTLPENGAGLDTWDPGGCDGPGGGMVADGAGDLFVADSYHNRVLEISPDAAIQTIAGSTCFATGSCTSNGDGGPATSAPVDEPFGVALDSAGNLFIADFNSIRKVASDGIITAVGGSTAYAYSGDGGLAAGAAFQGPGGIAIDASGNIYFADTYNNAIRVLRPIKSEVAITAVVDAASQRPEPASPGKIVVLYGVGLGPTQLTTDPNSGARVSFNGADAQVLYSSATQLAAMVPASISDGTAQVTVSYQGGVSPPFTVSVTPSSPGIFTLNQTGAGQAAAINADGSVNTAAKPVKIGGVISLYATGAGVSTPPLPVSVTIGGIPATIQYAGGAPGQAAGLTQLNVQVPTGVQPGGYVPVVLQVGDASTTAGAVWIAVSEN